MTSFDHQGNSIILATTGSFLVGKNCLSNILKCRQWDMMSHKRFQKHQSH